MTETSTTLPTQITTKHAMATRITFLIVGTAMSAWAPLVPYAKARLQINDATLGLLVLCLGMGALIAMPLAAALVGRYGYRRVVVSAVMLFLVALFAMATAPTLGLMAIAILFFGAAGGLADVAMNMQAIVVEKSHQRAMMSGFHGFYSLGGVVGAGLMSLLLFLGLSSTLSVLFVIALGALVLMAITSGLLTDTATKQGPAFAMPRGRVLLIGSLCAVVFLAEGAVLDWSAVFLNNIRQVDLAYAGLGFAAFSVVMTIARLMGDRIVGALGGHRVILWGGAIAALGFMIVVMVPHAVGGYIGFALVGLGASNIVPVLFSSAGKQQVMPVGLALAAVASMGYAGLLMGPALIGFIAQASSLLVSFSLIAAALIWVAFNARKVPQ